MEEILIEEKKYVSSKQAAKITGYAKDYIGQLCREGRVPARLVGRSWYVLESAIQDHRFGAQEAEEKPVVQTAHSTSFSVSRTWESPRYEASRPETLPTINRLHETSNEGVVASHEQHGLHDAWKKWFEHVADADTQETAKEEIQPVVAAAMESEEEIYEEQEETIEDKGVVNVPLRVVSRYIPSEPLPMMDIQPIEPQDEPIPQQEIKKEAGENRRMPIRSIKVTSVLIAMTFFVLAVIGSGYFDQFIGSDSQFGIISGISTYNK